MEPLPNKKIAAIVVAAGSASRMQGIDKQSLMVGRLPVLVRSLSIFQQMEEIAVIAAVIREEKRQQVDDYIKEYNLDKVQIVIGGSTRQRSVQNGIQALPVDTSYFVIHDGARPFADAELVRRCIRDAQKYGAATAAVKAKDTIKVAAPDQTILSTPDRDTLYLTQTPQVFQAELYRKASAMAEREQLDFTDDCQLIEHMGGKVVLSKGDYRNMKVTTPEDLPVAEAIANAVKERETVHSRKGGSVGMRIGHGYDVHRLAVGRKLILGGVEIEWEKGLLGHSDADVLTHAVMDALLGAAAMGDIGQHFPDTASEYEGADSIALLKKVAGALQESGYRIANIDSTIVAQRPKLMPYLSGMRERIAGACGIGTDCVSVKATTEEKLGFTGSGEGISAHSVCLLERL